jgi:hypothetical protein
MHIAKRERADVLIFANPAHRPSALVDVLDLCRFRIGVANKIRTGINESGQTLTLRVHRPARAPCLRLLNGPLHRRPKAFEAVLEQVISCTELQTPHGSFVADGAGDHDHRHVRSCLLRVRQSGDADVTMQVVVAEDEIEWFSRERGFEPGLRAHQRDVAGNAFGVQLVANHIGVPRDVLQMEHAEWTEHVWLHSLTASLGTSTYDAWADVEDLDHALGVGGDAREVGAVEDRPLQRPRLGQSLGVAAVRVNINRFGEVCVYCQCVLGSLQSRSGRRRRELFSLRLLVGLSAQLSGIEHDNRGPLCRPTKLPRLTNRSPTRVAPNSPRKARND